MIRTLVLLCAALSAALPATFRAGAARRQITPDLTRGPVYLAGFGANRVATGVHDQLWVRCVAMESGRLVVLCGVDVIGLFQEDVQRIRDQALERIGLAADILIAATHTHQGPDTMGLWGPAEGKTGVNEEYQLFLTERASEAIAEAVKSLRPATVKAAGVRTSELDSFIADSRPPQVLDSELVALQFSDRSGKTIATLVNWANHPEVLGSKNTQVTADFPNWLYQRLEKLAGGVTVFVNGALGGMMSPLGAKVEGVPEESFEKAERIGGRVAALAHAALRDAKPLAVERLDYKERAVEIPLTNQGFRRAMQAGLFQARRPLTSQGALRTSAGLLRFWAGEKPLLECALIPGELYPELSAGGIERFAGADFPDAPKEPAVKSLMRATYRMLIGLANDEIGYIIPKAEWDEKAPWLQNASKRWYGEVNSVGPEAAPLITGAIRDLIEGKTAAK